MANDPPLRTPRYVGAWKRQVAGQGAWRRQIAGYRPRPSIVRRCLVPLSDGKPCGRPATTFDADRGHLVCWYHLPARGHGEVQ